MNPLETQLLKQETGGAEPRFAVRTRTGIDAGRWWRRTSLWLCAMSDELVLLGVSRRRYIERAPFSECGESHYNHATGELVLAPIETLRFSRFAMSPRDALRVLTVMMNTGNAQPQAGRTLAQALTTED